MYIKNKQINKKQKKTEEGRQKEKEREEVSAHADLFLVREGGVNKLAIEYTGALGVWRQ